jgi:hypothetical protein
MIAAQYKLYIQHQHKNSAKNSVDHKGYSAGNFSKSGKRTFEGPEKWTFSFDPQISLPAAPHKTQKTELILAKLQHENSNKEFNIKFEMTLYPQEKR